MPDCKQCCGTCHYGSYDEINGYVCVNSDSEYVADFTEYNHTCDFLGRETQERTIKW